MPSFVFCRETHRLIDAGEFYARKGFDARRVRSDLPCPGVISDDLGPDGLVSDADGKRYFSRAEWLRGVKAAGCELISRKERIPPPKKHEYKPDPGMKAEIVQRLEPIIGGAKKVRIVRG
jgi:hypothetical protein